MKVLAQTATEEQTVYKAAWTDYRKRWGVYWLAVEPGHKLSFCSSLLYLALSGDAQVARRCLGHCDRCRQYASVAVPVSALSGLFHRALETRATIYPSHCHSCGLTQILHRT